MNTTSSTHIHEGDNFEIGVHQLSGGTITLEVEATSEKAPFDTSNYVFFFDNTIETLLLVIRELRKASAEAEELLAEMEQGV